MRKKRAIFRLDANSAIGTGHLSRCSVLANELSKLGFSIILITDCEDKTLLEKFDCVDPNDIRIIERPDQNVSDFLSDDENIELLVVDHYGLDKAREEKQRRRCARIVVVDDLADRQHDCDLLLDQNYYSNADSRYNELIGKDCLRLLGPMYSLLKPEYFDLKGKDEATSRGNQILVFLGGADVAAMSEPIVSHLLRKYQSLEVLLLVGPLNQSREKLEDKFNNDDRVTILGFQNSLLPVLQRCKLGILGCGSVLWEAFAAGMPTAVVTMTKEQIPLAENLCQDGYITYLGHSTESGDERFWVNIDQFLENPNLRSERSQHAKALVDGQGVLRVATAISELTKF